MGQFVAQDAAPGRFIQSIVNRNAHFPITGSSGECCKARICGCQCLELHKNAIPRGILHHPFQPLWFPVPLEPAEAFEIQPSSYVATVISDTFHGRDIFAPVAAALAGGIKVEDLGIPVSRTTRLPALIEMTGSEIHSRIIHIDRFGNAVTGIERCHLDSELLSSSFALRVGETVVRVQKRFYSEEPAVSGEPFVIWGSLNFLEISVTNGSAAELLNWSCGQEVVLRLL